MLSVYLSGDDTLHLALLLGLWRSITIDQKTRNLPELAAVKEMGRRGFISPATLNASRLTKGMRRLKRMVMEVDKIPLGRIEAVLLVTIEAEAMRSSRKEGVRNSRKSDIQESLRRGLGGKGRRNETAPPLT